MHDFVTVFETERLILSELDDNDAAFMLKLVNSPGWLKYIGDRNIKSIRKAKKYINSNYRKDYPNGLGLYCMRLKETQEQIGNCGLIVRDILPLPDIGFALLPEYQGNGYVHEAATHIIKQSRALGLVNKISAITVEYNHRSIKLLNKLGLKYKKRITYPGDDEELLYMEG